MVFRILFWCLFFCFSCSNQKNAYQIKSEKIILSLAKDLEKVQTVDDLKKQAYKIRKKFMQLTELMIEAKKNKKVSAHLPKKEVLSDRLLYELYRLSKDRQCLKMLKELQRDALEKITSFDEKESNS